jgi:hypothetical protein
MIKEKDERGIWEREMLKKMLKVNNAQGRNR